MAMNWIKTFLALEQLPTFYEETPSPSFKKWESIKALSLSSSLTIFECGALL